MKQTPFILVFSLMLFLVGCQEKSAKKSSSVNALCSGMGYYTNPSCPGYSGTTTGGTGSCSYGNNNFLMPGCPGFCQTTPSHPSCSGGGTTVGGTTGGGIITNPFPFYGSAYADKNWQVKYPYVPAIDCSTPVAPSGISYTPYETRKGTVTVIGAGFNPVKNPDPISWYDPRTYNALPSGDQTSERLRTVAGAKKFFWTDTTLKVRFKANLQPDSSQANPICAGRIPKAWIKGYSRLKFNLYLVGLRKNANNKVYATEEFLGEQTIDINKCTPALNLASHNGVNYPSKYPEGIYLKIKNVRGNQNWAPGTYAESVAYDTWGFYPNSAYDGNSYFPAIRSNDCWSVDIEVAADGTKTF